ncbi:MAG: VWA domain-containing protein [Acidobacteriota bacterium]
MKSKYFLAILCVAFTGCFVQSAPVADLSSEAGSREAKNQPSGEMSPAIVAFGQAKKADGIYIIFDASGSMAAQLPDKTSKIQVAKQVLKDFVARPFAGYELALRVYGHRNKEDCTDSQLLIPFNSPDKVVAELDKQINRINALGRTPITYSLTQALQDFGDRNGEIILISDGIESCQADPCALVREWKNQNVKIRVHVVGFGLASKEKETLRCISEAAGTAYHDAHSATALAAELVKIQQETVAASLILQGVDSSGKSIAVSGILARAGKEIYKVSSEHHNTVQAGAYLLTAGVLTQNGNLYKPTIQKVEMRDSEPTLIKVMAAIPPSVRARFINRGETQSGSLIHAYQNGKVVFSFRPTDEVYLDEGTYEFRARPNAANDLSVSETFAAGDHKEIVFGMTHTVKVTVKMVASGSGEWFRENYELWQNGEKKYVIHVVNGATVIPGVYDVVLPNRLAAYTKKSTVITEEKVQHFDISVPVGYVTFIYQKADGSPDKNDRCFVARMGGNENIFRHAGVKYPFTAGRYRVSGWQQKGDYNPIIFEVHEGQEQTVVLRAKK